ncbi:MAG: hypothetical protein ACI30N_05710 [Muribaculaceae bacterium]
MKTKSIVLSALAALAIMGGTADNTAQAQSSVGYWTLYPQYTSSSVSNIIDTGDKMFYLAMNRLHSYDKANNESYSYNTSNKLNDSKVINLFYFPEIESLLIVYETGNLDLLDIKKDKVVNLSDIADANINYNKEITNAYYHNGRIFVTTVYGLVVFDAKRHHVVDSGIYGTKVTYVAAAGDYLYLLVDEKQNWMSSPITDRHNSLTKFKETLWSLPKQAVSFGDKSFLQHAFDNKVHVMKQKENSCELDEIIVDVTPAQPMVANADGTVTVVTSSEIVTLSPEAADNNYILSRKNIPADFKGKKVTSCDGGKTMWVFASDGISNYTVADDGSLTVNIDKMTPNALVVDEIARMAGNANGDLFMISYGIGLVTDYAQGNNANKPAYVGMLSNGNFYDITPYKEDGTPLLTSPQAIIVDPVKPNRIYVGTFRDGVAVIEDGKLVTIFNKSNMPSYGWYGGGVLDLNFDRQNNLWVGSHNTDDGLSLGAYAIITRDKLNSDLTQIKKEDWKHSADANNFSGSWDLSSVICTKHDVMVIRKAYGGELHVIDMKGNPSATSTHEYRYLSSYIDQDGKQFTPPGLGWLCGIKDKDDNIWLGTESTGVVRITDPRKLGTAESRVERVKVPRNDGTNYADYLLESERILCMAVDHSNRKWIGTKNSGVYLVSPNGDKILEHFTTSNSILPSNCVISIFCDPSSNNVYFGTRVGLASYSSSSAPAAEDYSDVYAYPNPVRPEYTGWITIKGLKDNSLVKIADASGNVFYEGRSQGGMAVWDGCNASGQRVPSGVYFVFASTSGENENNDGAVTKIMVIR